MAYTFYTAPVAKEISYGKTRPVSDIKYIVIHYTGNSTDKALSNARYYAGSNKREAGAHFFIDGTSIYQSIPPTKVAYAVGGSLYSDVKTTGGGKLYGKCTNSNSVSIELCSTGGKFSDATLENAAEFTRSLMKKYNIDSAHVVRHFDVTGKHCPGNSGWYGTDSSKWFAWKTKVREG